MPFHGRDYRIHTSKRALAKEADFGAENRALYRTARLDATGARLIAGVERALSAGSTTAFDPLVTFGVVPEVTVGSVPVVTLGLAPPVTVLVLPDVTVGLAFDCVLTPG